MPTYPAGQRSLSRHQWHDGLGRQVCLPGASPVTLSHRCGGKAGHSVVCDAAAKTSHLRVFTRPKTLPKLNRKSGSPIYHGPGFRCARKGADQIKSVCR